MNLRSFTSLLAVAAAAALTGCATKPDVMSGVPAAEAGTPAAQPITGAFGLTLRERFASADVAKVLSENDLLYFDQNGTQRKGKVFKVHPKTPHEAFGEYLVATTSDGLIYSITGSYADPGRNPSCESPQRIAAELERQHGAPSPRPAVDEWTFRDASAQAFRGVKLHASQCRSGRYSIVYTDDAAKSPPPPTGR